MSKTNSSNKPNKDNTSKKSVGKRTATPMAEVLGKLKNDKKKK